MKAARTIHRRTYVYGGGVAVLRGSGALQAVRKAIGSVDNSDSL